MSTPARLCDEDGCERRHLARGLCGMHYARRQAAGIELPPTEVATAAETHRTVVTDAENRIGDCAACGPGVDLLLYNQGKLKCAEWVRFKRKRRNEQPSTQEWRRNYNRARKYGFKDVDEMRAAIEAAGGCDLCERPLTFRTARFDHDHACCGGANVRHSPNCGKCLRGVLCNSCNTALGMFRDNPALLRKAAAYVSQELRLDVA